MHNIVHEPLRVLVAQKIRAMIINGELTAGERLIENRLSEKLGVSRNPIREAIRLLESTGLVEVRPRRGAYVSIMEFADIKKVQDLRILLESWIIGEAAIHHSPADIQKIDDCIRLGMAASEEGDTLKASEMHRNFHLAIEDAANNDLVKAVMDPLRSRTELVFSIVTGSSGLIIWEEHRLIRDALSRRDKTLAQSLMTAHIEKSLERFKKWLASSPTSK